MKISSSTTISGLLFAIGVSCQNVPITDCSLLGPVYPVPANLTGSKAIRNAQTAFAQSWKQALNVSSTPWGPINTANTSISLAVFSTQSDKLLAEYHHIGSNPDAKTHLTGGILNADTIYRTGSIGKLLTVYTFLAKLGVKYWNEPVTKYVPELAGLPTVNMVKNFNWSEVTLGALAGQMAGLPRDYALADLSAFPGMDFTALGFPQLPPSQITTCGTVNERPCSTEEALNKILEQNPIAPAWQTPVYSNEAYQLLSLAYENITGEGFGDAFMTGVVEPLNLKRTSWTPPPVNDSNMVWVDPKGVSTVELDLGGGDAGGGTWTSLGDMAAIGRSMLRSTLLPAYITREWFKPISHSNTASSSVGRPWEIFSMNVPVAPGSNKTRLAYSYTKNGGIGGYNAEILLDPDHEIGIVTFVAGFDPAEEGAGTLWSLSELALRTWVFAAEAAARDAAAANYAGTFVSEDGLNSTMTLALIPDYTGLRITHLVYNNTDILEVLQAAFGYTGMSLQYMNLHADGQLAFRGNYQTPRTNRTNFLANDCNAYWTGVDYYKYGNVGLDKFVISVDKNGKAIGIDMPALRTNFSKRVK